MSGFGLEVCGGESLHCGSHLFHADFMQMLYNYKKFTCLRFPLFEVIFQYLLMHQGGIKLSILLNITCANYIENDLKQFPKGSLVGNGDM